ncbi:plasmolipin [Catenovulum agarivorans DS-2]|uniref:Plasmolipin n=1 Tax=Catenovulum agarivorans DS-2 TaxID=1328313 RepID=W7QKE4_9ALTE|nr:PepSY-associated TM helix domain-containing protein [Catenovulum agarivorans]EWH09422.1 plasmolipin [Catenovulum agarivorans DS-2]
MQFSLGSVRQWHWISAAFALVGMLLFAITGITLNHAADIKAAANVQVVETEIPARLITTLKKQAEQSIEKNTTVKPKAFTTWLAEVHNIQVSSNAKTEWSDDELYIVQAGPGSDAWLAVDFYTNQLTYEKTDRGWIAYFNDLHKGRDTGTVWRWFIDFFAVVCIVFCLSGLILLCRQANHRWMTWPITLLGVVAPAILLLAFVH